MTPLTREQALAVLAAVASCPHRGSELPLSRQPYLDGCNCGSLTECRNGRGRRPGAVTTEECVACRYAALNTP